ncbi:MAG: beta-ketoacyl synthase [Chromatocurvus sp.]
MSHQALPVIVGFGGINSAGRVSGHHAYARLVESRLATPARERMLAALRQVQGLPAASESEVLAGSLIRRIEAAHFDPDAVPWNRRVTTGNDDTPTTFQMGRRGLPEPLPTGWSVTDVDGQHVSVTAHGPQDILLPSTRDFEVKVASQLPSGFDPGKLYASRNHPRGLQMAVYAASDALGQLGIDWSTVMRHVSVDAVSVYAGSAMGQLDDPGTGGMLKARSNGQRSTSKYCPLGLAEMPSDFINAYVLGSLGSTGATLGACASFLYNLRNAVHDIRSGRARVAVVGGSEAPVTPEVMEGYAAMGALATDKGLRQLDGLSENEEPDHRRACRPFADNCGFTVGESAQVLVLFDDALALELGASVYGAVTDVFVNADGYKKSISGPGVGNYITVARALAAARAIVGEQALRRGGLVQAHGTGTPQNRTTESGILSRSAAAFGIDSLPVAALKCYFGHSLGAAAGDQIAMTLGTWCHGLIPGITTTPALADDVTRDHLDFCLQHTEIDTEAQAWALINAKGFGGNNASAMLLSPTITARMLRARHGERSVTRWQTANESVVAAREAYDQGVLDGHREVTYRFDHDVLSDRDISYDDGRLTVGGAGIDLHPASPFSDMQPAQES